MDMGHGPTGMEGSGGASAQPDRIKVGLIEDQVLFREGIKAILGEWPDLRVVFESPDGYSVQKRLSTCGELPDVVLLDLSLPPDGQKEFSGIDVTHMLRDHYPDMKILILSVHDDDHFIAMLMKNGAHGYLVKDSNPKEVYDAIVTAHTRGLYVNEKTLRAIQSNAEKKNTAKALTSNTIQGNAQHIELTRREEEILEMICQQKTTDEIARALFISPRTVNGHRNNLLQKTGSRNVAGLVAFALTRS